MPGADEYGDHGHSGFALRRNEVVESERELHEYGADQVDGDEVDRIFDGRIAGAEGVENRPFRQLQQHGEGQAMAMRNAALVPRMRSAS